MCLCSTLAELFWLCALRQELGHGVHRQTSLLKESRLVAVTTFCGRELCAP